MSRHWRTFFLALLCAPLTGAPVESCGCFFDGFAKVDAKVHQYWSCGVEFVLVEERSG